MKLLTLFLTLVLVANIWGQSNCENLDFEDGNMANWISTGVTAVVNKDQVDYYGGFPTALSRYYAVQLGNTTDSESSLLKRTLTIDNTNKYFIYSYAIVLLGYPHFDSDAARVNISVYDENNNVLPCGQYTAIAQPDQNEGFYLSDRPAEQNLAGECCYPIYYQPWKTNAIDLTPYVGQTLTIEITNSWCIYNVDWGYSYFDAYCTSDLIYEFKSCDSESYFIQTIDGFASYQWTGPGIVSGQGTNIIEVNQPGTYVVGIPNPNPSCPDIELEVDASQSQIPDIPEANFVVSSTCISDTIFLQNTTQCSSPVVSSTWIINTDTIGNFHAVYPPNSDNILDITLIIENQVGCVDSMKQILRLFAPKPFDIGDTVSNCPGELVKLENLFDQNTNLIWSTGETAPYIEVFSEGYFSAIFNDGSCISYDTVFVDMSDQVLGIIPNVFTPNNDQINDFFTINASGLKDFHFVITNRWGNVVFETMNQPVHWDGWINNEPVTEGVYFYKLSFRCDDASKEKSGFLHVSK